MYRTIESAIEPFDISSTIQVFRLKDLTPRLGHLGGIRAAGVVPCGRGGSAGGSERNLEPAGAGMAPEALSQVMHGSLKVPIEHHPTIGIWSIMATIR